MGSWYRSIQVHHAATVRSQHIVLGTADKLYTTTLDHNNYYAVINFYTLEKQCQLARVCAHTVPAILV